MTGSVGGGAGPAYLDAAATTPVDHRVAELAVRLMVEEFGNAGSRTHEVGAAAKRTVEHARQQVAAVVGASPDEVVFTSGATESDNLAVLGLLAQRPGGAHLVTTAIEHKAVLEPVEALRRAGVEVDLVRPGPGGAVAAEDVLERLRPGTVLVSVMQVNNETGVRQPLEAIAEGLPDGVYLHTDAAQGFGKELGPLRHERIDLISASGHKVFGPKGVGALIARRRDRRRPPLAPLMYGGGQERGIRPGTIPVPLVGALGLAAELAVAEHASRREACLAVREALEAELALVGAVPNGDPALTVPHILNVSVPGLDGEAAILALRGLVAVSNGSACTSERYEPSHVLAAMGVGEEAARGAIRFSWSHLNRPEEVAGIGPMLKRVL